VFRTYVAFDRVDAGFVFSVGALCHAHALWHVLHFTDKVHRLRTQIKPASTLSNATYVLNTFTETATCFS